MKNTYLTKALRSIAFNYREGGTKQIVVKILEKVRHKFYEQEEMFLVESFLESVADQRSEFHTRILSFDDLYSLGYTKAKAFPEVIQERFDRHEECFGYFLEGKLTHVAWVSCGYLAIAENFPVVKIENGSGIYDVVTIEEYRGKGICPFALCHIQGILKTRGQIRAVAAIHSGNIPSQKAFRKAGFRYAYSLCYRRRLFFLTSVRKVCRG